MTRTDPQRSYVLLDPPFTSHSTLLYPIQKRSILLWGFQETPMNGGVNARRWSCEHLSVLGEKGGSRWRGTNKNSLGCWTVRWASAPTSLDAALSPSAPALWYSGLSPAFSVSQVWLQSHTWRKQQQRRDYFCKWMYKMDIWPFNHILFFSS